MRGFFFGIFGIAFLSGICGILSPEGSVKKYVGLIGSLCVVSSMVLSFGAVGGVSGMIGGILDGIASAEDMYESEDYAVMYEAVLKEAGEEETERRLASLISERTDTVSDSFLVDVEFGEGEGAFIISSVRVTIFREGVSIDPHDVREYVSSLTGAECEIVYEMNKG